MKTTDDVRRYLADLINRLEAGQIEPAVAGRCGFLCNILLRAIEGGLLEDRVAALERQFGLTERSKR